MQKATHDHLLFDVGQPEFSLKFRSSFAKLWKPHLLSASALKLMARNTSGNGRKLTNIQELIRELVVKLC